MCIYIYVYIYIDAPCTTTWGRDHPTIIPTCIGMKFSLPNTKICAISGCQLYFPIHKKKLEIGNRLLDFRFIMCKFHNWKSIEIQRKVHFPCATQVRHRCVALEKQLIVDAKIYEEPGGLLGHVSSCLDESPTVAKLEAVGNCPFTMNSRVVSDIVSWKHIAILRASQTRYKPLRITRTDIQIARPHAANLIKLIY